MVAKRTKRRGFKLWERRILVSWLRFSRRHRDSKRLPFILFLVVFLDGFTMVVPSMLCLMASVTISPARWMLFAFIFPCAATLNNLVTYTLATLIPLSSLMAIIDFFHLQSFWQEAGHAIHRYGDGAAFVGALLGLPTQMITAIIGLADIGTNLSADVERMSIVWALTLVFVGHSLKAFLLSGLTRHGWIKLEHKLERNIQASNKITS